jgi:prepilin-type N-terminal cleavage/methylation domain-containing protein
MRRDGFTLVELLVVIGIIGILVVALVPVVKGAQTKAKEATIKTNCANIESALAAYAQNHNGNYPGTAVDIIAPWPDHALGDPDLFATGGGNLRPSTTGVMVEGVLGGWGHYINSSSNVFELIKAAKDSAPDFSAGPVNTGRYIDVMMASDAIQEYPANPFVTNPTTGARVRMRNIFGFNFQFGAGFGTAGNFTGSSQAASLYNCYLSVSQQGTAGGGLSFFDDQLDPSHSWMYYAGAQWPMGGSPVVNSTTTPQAWSAACRFGPEEGDYFAPGDFAYVPVLSASANSDADSLATIENETYKWGTSVSGYLLFGYGSGEDKNKDYEQEQAAFIQEGLPGFGGAGVDTMYENYVLHLFEGAVYYSKKI